MEKFKDVIAADMPTLVQFSAEWCGPCQAMKPVVEKLESDIKEKARVVKIDVDKYDELVADFRIQTVPTFIIFKQGQPMWRHSGVIQENELKVMLENYL